MLDRTLASENSAGSSEITMPAPPPRQLFWDESIPNLLSRYEAFREDEDEANAAACFGRLARYRFRELSSLPNFDPSRKSIISVFQPKSGGTFLHNRLLQLGYKEFWWCFPYRFCHSICYASDEALQYYLSGGCTCHTHVRPDPNILAALDRAHVDKIWVHLRNPAESVVSAYHHYLGEGHGEGAIGEQRAREAIAEAERFGHQVEAGKNAFVMEHIDWYADWAASWLQFAQERPGLVEFSFHRELVDSQAMFSRVFAELGAELRGCVSAAPAGDDRFRNKEVKDWRVDLSPAARDFLEQRVRAKLVDFAAFESLWS